MSRDPIRTGFAICGSFCTFSKILPVMQELAGDGFELMPIMSHVTYTTDTRFGKAEDIRAQVEEICGRKIISTIADAEPIGPKKLLDILIIAPCTGNTAAKLAGGITDTPVTMAAKAHLRNSRPVLLGIATNDALGGSAQNIGRLLNVRNFFFIPFAQDDAKGKPASMVADFGRTKEAALAALDGEQLRPVVFG